MYDPRSDAALQRALNRYYSASQNKAFQGTIPRYESEASEAAWDAIDWELERARECVEALIQRRVEAAKAPVRYDGPEIDLSDVLKRPLWSRIWEKYPASARVGV